MLCLAGLHVLARKKNKNKIKNVGRNVIKTFINVTKIKKT